MRYVALNIAFGYFTISGSDTNNNRIPKICRDSLSRMPRYELQGRDFIGSERKNSVIASTRTICFLLSHV